MGKRKRKVTITISEDVWKKWIIFIVKKTGSLKASSRYIEKAILEYMERHGGKNGNE